MLIEGKNCEVWCVFEYLGFEVSCLLCIFYGLFELFDLLCGVVVEIC